MFMLGAEWHYFETGCVTAVQSHPRSSILAPVESEYTTACYWSIATSILSCTVSEMRRPIGWKLRTFLPHSYLMLSPGMNPFELLDELFISRIRVLARAFHRWRFRDPLRRLTQCYRVTDRATDRRTDMPSDSKHMALRWCPVKRVLRMNDVQPVADAGASKIHESWMEIVNYKEWIILRWILSMKTNMTCFCHKNCSLYRSGLWRVHPSTSRRLSAKRMHGSLLTLIFYKVL